MRNSQGQPKGCDRSGVIDARMDQEQLQLLVMSAVQLFLIIQGKLKESVVLWFRVMCSLGWPGSQIENLLLQPPT